MEDTTEIITTTIITNLRGLVLTTIAIFFTGVILGFLILFNISIIFGVAILIIICISPVIFQKQIRKNFVADVTIKIHLDHISFAYFYRNSSKTKIVRCSEITSLKVIESTGDDSSFITFYHKDGAKSIYRFLGQTKNDGNVIPNILRFIKAYNETKGNSERIHLRKTFIASKSGYYFIVGLIITANILGAIYKPSAIPGFLIPSLLFYLVIWSHRNLDLKAKV